MTVEIKTLYLGGPFYRIAVVLDGGLLTTYRATVGTVVQKRDRLFDYWSQNADRVDVGEIPKATDMR